LGRQSLVVVGATTLATAGTFLAIDAIRDAADQPPVYDYGVNVIYQGDDVYVDGKKTATAAEYSQQAIAWLTNPRRRRRRQDSSRSGCQWEFGH
jgi:hypothetical protein